MHIIPTAKKTLRQFSGDASGAVFIMVALALTVILTATGVAVEMSRYSKAKAQFNHALDQAVLAAAAQSGEAPADIETYARRYFETNLQSDGIDVKISEFTVSSDAGKVVWKGDAKGTMDTVFSQVLGVNAMNLSHNVTVKWDDSTKTELVAMVDVSGTMCANFERTKNQNGSTSIDFVPDRSCTKLNMMKEALREITTIGVGYGPDLDVSYKVGIVPFTYKVRVPNPTKVPAFLLNAERAAGFGANYYTNLADAQENGPALPAVTPLTPVFDAASKAAVLKKIDAIATSNNQEFNRAFMKRSSLGAQISALMLDPRYHGMFGGEKPAQFGAPNTEKIVILMTDSANLGCCFTNWPQGNFRNHYIYSYGPDHKKLVGEPGKIGLCEQMKDAGIEIYTVLLDVNRSDMDARGSEIVDAFQSCASTEKHAFEVPRNDRAKLKEVYKQIGKNLIKLRISE